MRNLTVYVHRLLYWLRTIVRRIHVRWIIYRTGALDYIPRERCECGHAEEFHNDGLCGRCDCDHYDAQLYASYGDN